LLRSAAGRVSEDRSLEDAAGGTTRSVVLGSCVRPCEGRSASSAATALLRTEPEGETKGTKREPEVACVMNLSFGRNHYGSLF
jgi:hypothetical protein